MSPLSSISTPRHSNGLSSQEPNGHKSEIWRDAPMYRGSTVFEPSPSIKNILVTGGAGFIACWLVRHLVLTYPNAYKIISFDNLDYCASLNNILPLDSWASFTFVRADITSPDDVLTCLQAHEVDTIVHFAAQSHVDLSFGNSYQFTSTNVYGTHVLLESAKACGIRRFVHISTDEVYGEVKSNEDELLESSILAPSNPYAASKAAAEMLVNAYWKSFDLPVIIVRCNNVYGPHQFPEKIIPKFSCLLQQKRKLLVHGDGRHTRRYLYAGDAADALDTILHRGAIGHTYNLASRDEISNLGLCAKLLGLFGLDGGDSRVFDAWVQHTKDRPFNDRRYAIDGSKLRNLGWEQKTTFDEGLRITVEWYRKYGTTWWGDISRILTPFPVIEGSKVFTEEEHEAREDHPLRRASLRANSLSA